MDRIEVLYNSVCPVCRAGACDIERRAAVSKAGIVLTDVSQNGEALNRAGLTLDQVRLKFHAIDRDGRLLAGMPAVALVWWALPSHRWLGELFGAPPGKWIGAFGYHIAAHSLWAWNRACGRW
jgi:predicted DCC family thiol-disulfide oxidoreductase YuxK